MRFLTTNTLSLGRAGAILASFLLVLAGLSAPVDAQRQGQRAKGAQNSERFDIRIQVLDPEDDRRVVDEVRPGETFVAYVGDTLRLRMMVADGGRDRALPKWPAARFEVVRRGGYIRVLKAVEKVGNMTFEGAKATAGAGPVEVRFEILDGQGLAARHRVGSIFLVFERDTAAAAPVGPGPESARGVILYEHPGFQGRSERFLADELQLNDNHIGADTASSVRLDPGCQVVIFEHPDFRGRAVVLESDTYDLRNTNLGADTASSLQLRCDGVAAPGSARRGVVLYEHQNFRGRSERFTADDSRLNDNVIRHDAASSLQVDPGCEVVLYEHPGYTGTSTLFRDSISDLTNTHVGNDRASSLTVRCN